MVTLLKCAGQLGHTRCTTLYNAKNELVEANLNSGAFKSQAKGGEIRLIKLRKRSFRTITLSLHCHTVKSTNGFGSKQGEKKGKRGGGATKEGLSSNEQKKARLA